MSASCVRRGILLGFALLLGCVILPQPARATLPLPYHVLVQDYEGVNDPRLCQGIQGHVWIYPNSGWSSVYGSKVNSIYSINQDGIFVEAGYFYEPPSGVTTPPMFFSSWQDRLGQRHEYWSLMSSAHIGSYRAFAVLRTSGDDYNTMYNGWTMHTYPDTEMVSSWSQAGMERAYYSTDNGNLSIQYLQSKLYSTGNWSYWPGPVLGLNDNDGRYKPDTSALLGSAHWYKVVVQ